MRIILTTNVRAHEGVTRGEGGERRRSGSGSMGLVAERHGRTCEGPGGQDNKSAETPERQGKGAAHPTIRGLSLGGGRVANRRTPEECRGVVRPTIRSLDLDRGREAVRERAPVRISGMGGRAAARRPPYLSTMGLTRPTNQQ